MSLRLFYVTVQLIKAVSDPLALLYIFEFLLSMVILFLFMFYFKSLWGCLDFISCFTFDIWKLFSGSAFSYFISASLPVLLQFDCWVYRLNSRFRPLT